MIEWEKDLDCLVASANGYDVMIEKTGGYGINDVPRSAAWTLRFIEPYYFCSCQPTRKRCMEMAERFVRVLPILRGEK